MTAIGSVMRTNAALSLIWLFTQNLLTKGKMVLAVALSLICLALGFAIRQGEQDFAGPDSIGFVYTFGLALMVPVLALVIASSSLGDLVEDESLVYIWMRPVGRLTIALAAWFASLILALPVTVVPLTAAVAIGSSSDAKLMGATAGAVGLAVIAYTGLFTLLGLLTRRALIVGLLYLFIWELFIARVGGGAARLSISTYPSAALVKWSEIDPFGLEIFGDRSLGVAISIPIAVAALSVVLTGFRLARSRVA